MLPAADPAEEYVGVGSVDVAVDVVVDRHVGDAAARLPRTAAQVLGERRQHLFDLMEENKTNRNNDRL